MAPVNPTRSTSGFNLSLVTWSGMATGDTITTDEPQGLCPLAGSVQVTGTFGGATVTLVGSNDGTNYVTLKDRTGSALSFTSAGLADFSTSVRFVKPAISGGSTDSVTATVVYRNQ